MIISGKKCNIAVRYFFKIMNRANSFGAVKAVILRHRRAVENVAEARQSFHSLTDTAPPDSVAVWKATIEEAEAARSTSPQAMDVMHSQIKTRQSSKEITAAILQDELSTQNLGADGSSTTDWLLEGLNIEDEQ